MPVTSLIKYTISHSVVYEWISGVCVCAINYELSNENQVSRVNKVANHTV